MTQTQADERALRRFHPALESQCRLICFPHAGGSATYYFPMSSLLTPAVEVVAVQYPGRQDRRGEPLIDDAAELAEHVLGGLLPWTDRPFAFFGHSMGATLAFEVARLLQARGHQMPRRLFVSGRRAPSRQRHSTIHRLPDAGLVDELRRAGGTDPRLFNDAELLATIIPMTRNDYKLIENYQYVAGDALACPVTALIGVQDPQVTLKEAEAWQPLTAQEFSLQTFPGGHFYLDAQLPAIVMAIRNGLDVPATSVNHIEQRTA